MAKFLVKRNPHFGRDNLLHPVGAIIDIDPPYANMKDWVEYLEPVDVTEKQVEAVPVKLKG